MKRKDFDAMITKLSFDSLTKELILNAYDIGYDAGQLDRLKRDIEIIENPQRKEYENI